MRHLIASLSFIGAALAMSGTASAQETSTEMSADKPASSTVVETPQRGSTMDSVRAKFGSPTQEVPAVGAPPISRWEYPTYIVYFEKDRVLHTVVK